MKKLLRFAFPIMMGNLLQQLYNAVYAGMEGILVFLRVPDAVVPLREYGIIGSIRGR